jgi:hypothetical protein
MLTKAQPRSSASASSAVPDTMAKRSDQTASSVWTTASRTGKSLVDTGLDRSRNRQDRDRRVGRQMTCAWDVLLTGVRPTHPFMAAPARARQGQHSGRIAHPSGETRLAGWRGQALAQRAKPTRACQAGLRGLAAGPGPLSHGADHERHHSTRVRERP